MAEIIKNSKGFKVIKISRTEIVEKLSKQGAVGICDNCISTPVEGYFVCVLNRWLCEKCYNEWMSRAVNYPEDRRYEDYKFITYSRIFNLTNL